METAAGFGAAHATHLRRGAFCRAGSAAGGRRIRQTLRRPVRKTARHGRTSSGASGRAAERMRIAWGVVCALAAHAAGVEMTLWNPTLIQQRLELASKKLPERRAAIEKLFTDAGCEVVTQPVRGSKEPN